MKSVKTLKKYEYIIDYITKSIQMGSLRVGDYLPSIRELSQILNISNITVYDAYCRLESMGVVSSNARRGFRLDAIESILGFCDVYSYSSRRSSITSTLQESHLVNGVMQKDMVPLGVQAPMNKYLPSDQLSKYMARIVRSDPEKINTYFNPSSVTGIVSHVEKMTAKFMYQNRGTIVPENEIISTNGAVDGVFLALSALAKTGDCVVVESPCYLALLSLINHLGLVSLEIEALPPHGLDIDKLEFLLETGLRPVCCIVTPNFHNPTGSLMPIENRRRLLELSQKHEMILIEDDVFGPLRFGKILPTLKCVMPDDVIYISSYSKIIAPGYRAGWIAGGKYTQELARVQSILSHSVMGACQETIAQYLESSNVKSFLKGLRTIYQENSTLMADAIEAYFPEHTQAYRPQGGQYLWVMMPESVSATRLHYEALKHKILLAPGSLFTMVQKNYDNCLRFCFAFEMNDKVLESIRIVGDLAKKIQGAS
jgi:DNA-binding transcriptional MocR family regulator